MKNLLLIIFLVSSLSSYSQNQDGEVKEYHSNSQLKSVGMKNNGLRTGKWKFFNENGTLSLVGKYIEGKRDGKWVDYNRSGNKYSITNYKNGEMHGKFEYYNDNGQTWKKGNARFGKTHGKVFDYNNGQLVWERNFHLGVESGKWKTYYENGKIKSITLYDNGKLNGISVYYYENGVIESKVEYKEGRRWNVMELNGSNGYPLLIGTLKNGFGTYYTYSSEDIEDKEVDRIYTYNDGKVIKNSKINSYDASEINIINYKNNPELRKRRLERELENERIAEENMEKEAQIYVEEEMKKFKEKERAKQKERDKIAKSKTNSTSGNTIVRSKPGARKRLEKLYAKNPANRNKNISNTYNRAASNRTYSNNSYKRTTSNRTNSNNSRVNFSSSSTNRSYNNSTENDSKNTKTGYYCYVYSWSNALENKPDGVAYVTNVFYVNMDFNGSNRHSTQLEGHFQDTFLARYGKSGGRYYTYAVSPVAQFPHTFATRAEAERSRTKKIGKFKYDDKVVRTLRVANYDK